MIRSEPHPLPSRRTVRLLEFAHQYSKTSSRSLAGAKACHGGRSPCPPVKRATAATSFFLFVFFSILFSRLSLPSRSRRRCYFSRVFFFLFFRGERGGGARSRCYQSILESKSANLSIDLQRYHLDPVISSFSSFQSQIQMRISFPR